MVNDCLETKFDILLSNASRFTESMQIDFENSGLYLGNGAFSVVLWSVQPWEPKQSEELTSGWLAEIECLKNTILQHFHGSFLHHSVTHTGGLLTLVCFPRAGKDSEDYNVLQEKLEATVKDILSALTTSDRHISAVISDVLPGMDGIEQAFRRAIDMQDYAQFLTSSPVLLTQKIMNPLDLNWEENILFRGIINSIVSCIQHGDSVQTKKKCEELLQYILQNPPYGKYYFNLRVCIIMNHLITEMVEHDLISSEFMEKLNPVFGLTSSKNEKEFREKFYDYVSMAEKCYHEKNQDPIKKKMASIRSYIEENYADINLTVSAIADMFNISQPALSYHFKKYRDCNPSEYILRTRVSNARARITTTTDTMDRIAEQSGFGSYISMRRAFEKLYHCPPGQFRTT